MSLAVCYFSGTGNSFSIAKKIAEKSGGNLIPIASLINKKEIECPEESLGIVFPVYYGILPNIVKKFAEKLIHLESKYIFAAATYGGGRGVSIKNLEERIRGQGGRLSAVYGIHMPQNTFRKPFENQHKIFKKADRMIERICENTDQKKEGRWYSNIVIDVLQRPVYPMVKSAVRKSLAELSGSTETKSIEELIYSADYSFTANDRCTSCGTCAEVCPVDNILVETGPQWLHKCENCLACYNACPQQAIEMGLLKKDYHYKHPDFDIQSMKRK